jgi:hypothetical protein
MYTKDLADVREIIKCLGIVYSQLLGVSKQLPKELALDSKAAQIVSFVTRSYIDNATNVCISQIHGMVNECLAE